MKQNKIKGVVIDIETSPQKVLMYGNIYEPVVVKILEYTQILSMAWREVGSKKTYYIGQNKLKGYKAGVNNDKNLVIKITNILKDFDYIVGHNSDNFDIKVIKERIMYHRLPALPEIYALDTKKLYKKVSKLPSNQLKHVSEFMGNGSKLKHNGVDMFLGCANGNKEDWKVNEKYNKKDVDITYADFIDVLPYVKLPNYFIYMNKESGLNCSNPNCLSYNLAKSKTRKVVNGWKMQYQCRDCGHYTTDTKLYKEN